jgi:hypothetical protein
MLTDAVFAASLIQTGPELLLSAVPKFTVTVVAPHGATPPVTIEAGTVVALVKEEGELPNP